MHNYTILYGEPVTTGMPTTFAVAFSFVAASTIAGHYTPG